MVEVNGELDRQLKQATTSDGVIDVDALVRLVSRCYDAADRQRNDAAQAQSLAQMQIDEMRLQLQRQADATRLQMSRFETAINSVGTAVSAFDAARRLVFCNARFRNLFRLDPELAAPGARLDALFDPVRQLAADVEHKLAQVTAYHALLDSAQHGQLLIDLAGGSSMRLTYEPTADGGFVLCFDDMTAHRLADLKIEHLSTHDELTGLPNRMVFHRQIAAKLAQLDDGRQFAVLCLDLDHFKPVNDTLGHPVGDTLMRAVTHRLRQALRGNDFVSRLGGDEFGVLLEGRKETLNVELVADRIVTELGRPYEIAGHRLVIGVSIGYVVAPVDGVDAVELIRCADVALRAAKLRGGGCHRSFDRQMDVAAKTRQSLEEDLRRAIGTDEFEIHYQPLVNVEARSISGFEALLRWNNPTHGSVTPQVFIALAEELNVIGALGEWVLKRACRDAAAWPAELKLAVNVSPKQFHVNDLLATVRAALDGSGLQPHRLELEITESVLMEKSADTVMTLHKLRELGVKIVMDDFGTGYSSLAYLSSFPFDKIKIDRTFINGLGRRSDAAAIVRAVTGLCRSLGIASTAEGVETDEQLQMLSGEACTEAQGYLFSKPCPVSELPALLTEFSRSGFRLATAA